MDGWHGDTSRMYGIGKLPIKAKKLMDVTYEAMMRGIEIIRPGVTLGDLGATIQQYVESHRYSVVRDFCGHGLGRIFHTNPTVLHYGKRGTGLVLEEGMFFTVEPMVNAGKYDISVLQDGWTAVVRKGDGSTRTFKPVHVIFAHGFNGGVPEMPSFPGMVSSVTFYNNNM